LDNVEAWRSPRSASTNGESSPFQASEIEKFYEQPTPTPARLDCQPSHPVKRDNGRVVFIEVCDQCEQHGQCIDTGDRVLCLECAA
jgi:hypothetical protein